MITLIPVEPLSRTPRLAFVNPGGLRFVDLPTYPRTELSDGLRALRLGAKLSLGDAARIVGIGVVEWSGLERGAYALSAEDRAQVDLLLRIAGGLP